MDPPKHPQATSNKQSNGSVSRWVPVSFSVSPSGFGRNEAADKIRRNLNDLDTPILEPVITYFGSNTGHRSQVMSLHLPSTERRTDVHKLLHTQMQA